MMTKVMKPSTNILVFCLSLIFMSGCASKKIEEESYVPSAKVIHLKSDLPVVHLWDRWNERSSEQVLVNGTQVVSSEALPQLLADDPSTEVAAKLRSAETWNGATNIIRPVSSIFWMLGLIGFIPNNGAQTFPTSTNLVFFGAGAATTVSALITNSISQSRVEEALAIHNSRIWKEVALDFPACGTAVGLKLRMEF